MAPGLTADAFGKLLLTLDLDTDRAGQKYEDLRRVLTRFFEWRGTPFPEEHTDETFNRVAIRIAGGVDVKNIGGYCYEVARLVCFEALKSNDLKTVSIEGMRLELQIEHHEVSEELPAQLACLDDCLKALPRESRELILEYYAEGKGSHVQLRKALAQRLGLQRDALANRAQRLRDKLQQCVKSCLTK